MRVRVLRVIARLNLGGPAYQAGLLSGRRLDPDRFETLLVHGKVAPGEESMTDFAEREGAQMEFLPSLVQPIRPQDDARALISLARIARKFRPHIVHSHTAKAGFLARQATLVAVRPRPVIIHTFEGHVLEGYFGRGKTQLYRTLERALGRSSDCLIGVSQATVDDLVRMRIAPRSRFRVIPIGLDLREFATLGPEPGGSIRDKIDLGMNDVLATYVGRVVPIKRLDVLLRALAVAREEGLSVHLAVVGDGEMRPDLETLACNLGLRDCVHFLGYRRDLVEIARASDMYVLSSDSEGTPVSLIEGGAAGRPLVATAVGGVAEVVIPGTGLLVDRHDHRALGAAMGRLAADRGLRFRLGQQARRHVLSLYSADRLLRDVVELYDDQLELRAALQRPTVGSE